ncbi:diaminopimelate decarboxylase [Actinacidiphila bryophytorum]|uniref:diaminopimelate decarboxylase n=1 Tax=Actinacidiphila bryophytorum TaxID=1436133 RepID=UPI00217697BE|nr:diaminopimelate decarboxylase [Actinacidiphila bryophytorum]UWE12211.1 diaminopimelate decarboxylase [Actinacidiphila bryophytorum]
MEALQAVLDCRGLSTALTVLRVKQAASSAATADGPLHVLLGEHCRREEVSRALGDVADRVRYVGPPGEEHSAQPQQDRPQHPPEDPWWKRRDLRYDRGRLHLGGVDMDQLARQVGTPAYVCRAGRVRENIERISAALANAGLDHRIYYAIKANRSPALLSYLRTSGLCGVDVCSTGELTHALGCGFPPGMISFTGTSLSRRDIEVLARFTDLRVNFDSVSALDRFGRSCPGRDVGLRINPAVGVGYQGDERLSYSGAATTKFGIYREHLAEAKAVAEKWGLRVVRLHLHAGCGYLDGQLDQLEAALAAADAFTGELPDLAEVNIGGGLGVPHTPADAPLDLERWAAAVARRFAGRGLTVAVEPGDYLVKDAGLLLTTATYVEQRREVLFAGLDAGFNLAVEPAFYGLPCEPVPVVPRWEEGTETYTVVGNINEALDQWAVGHRMTRLREGDRIALINSGGYAASMRSDHCLRGEAGEVLLIDEQPPPAP